MPSPLPIANFTPLNIPENAVHKMSEKEIAAFQTHMRDMLIQKHTKPINLENHPSQQPYATIKVNGKVVATLYNSGAMATSNALAPQLTGMPNDGTGPNLAQRRAEYIAKKLGGTITPAKTALTEMQWQQVPPLQFKVDEAALKADPLYNQIFNNTPAKKETTSLFAQMVAAQE